MTVFSLTLNNCMYLPFTLGVDKIYPALDAVYLPFELLIIPSFFFFVNHYFEYKNEQKTKFLLIFPFLFYSLFYILDGINLLVFNGNLIPKNLKSDFIDFEEFFTLFYSFLLIFLILRKIKTYEKENSIYAIEKVKAKTKWLKDILFLGYIICLFWLGIIVSIGNNFSTNLYYILWICISFLIYWISYTASSNYALLMERKNIRNEILFEANKTEIKRKKQLDGGDMIFGQFEDYIQKSYTNPYLSIEDVAKELNISSNYLSQIINQKSIKFNSYLNSFRIEAAKKMLSNKAFSKYTIAAIGLEAGFNSKASFYRAFKINTGTTPVEYRKSTFE